MVAIPIELIRLALESSTASGWMLGAVLLRSAPSLYIMQPYARHDPTTGLDWIPLVVPLTAGRDKASVQSHRVIAIRSSVHQLVLRLAQYSSATSGRPQEA